MEYKKYGDIYVVRMNRGEEVVETLLKFCDLERVALAAVSAIGACNYVNLGLYNIEEQKYYEHELTGPMEITSLVGNITHKEGKPYVHLHITVADEQIRSFGGHMKKCVISGTCEMFIHVVPGQIGRMVDDATGLNVFSFSEI